MLRPLPVLCLALLCALAALPAASAQAGVNDPKIAVTVTVTPKNPTIPLGGMQTFKVDVKLTTTNVFCPNPGKVTVGLAPKDSGLPGVVGTLPSSVDVTIAANVGGGQASVNSQGNNTASLVVTVDRTASPDHDHSFTVVATTPAALPSGCSALSASAPPVATGSGDVSLRTGPAGISGGTSGVTVSAGTCGATVAAPGVSVAAGGSCTQKSFFVPLQLQVAALLGLALLRRRA
ncbi:MAG: hypothetical protein QOI63_2024 [Thermoplasmata archaeon]|jgi:hypothetical protein|nr:hypothetical protein [Thermoplasmata archaeon]